MRRRWKGLLGLVGMVAVAVSLTPSMARSAPPDAQVVVQAALEARARALVDSTAVASVSNLYDNSFADGAKVVGGRLASYEQSKLQEFHAYAEQRGMHFIDQKVTLQFEDIQASGNVARVQVTESLSLSYVYPKSAKPTAVNTFGLGMHHSMVLVLAGNRWLIQRDDYIDSFRDWLGPDHSTVRSEASAPNPAPTGVLSDGGIQPMGTAYYDGTLAASYADTYCGAAAGCGNSRLYNSGVYAKESDDCTNFVSQALGDSSSGGGAPQSSPRNYSTNWYYDYPSKSGSVAWVRASSLISFLTNNPRGHTYDYAWMWAENASYTYVTQPTGSYTNGLVWDMYQGDVLGYDFTGDAVPDHASVVAAYDSQGYPLVDAHNSDRYHAPWDLGYWTNAHYWLVRMKGVITI